MQSWADLVENDKEDKLVQELKSESRKDGDKIKIGADSVSATALAAAAVHEHKIQFLTTGDLDVQQADPSSPLHSATSFEELNLKPELLRAVYANKFTKPSKIQGQALPLLLAEPPANMVAQSQSGTGKTAAFVLGMLSRVVDTVNSPQALCVSPSRELAIQTFEVVKSLGQFMPNLRPLLAVKNEPLPPSGASVEAQVIVGSPGTILELIKTHASAFGHVKVIVFDEADQMFDQSNTGKGKRGPGGKAGKGKPAAGNSMADQSNKIKKFCEQMAQGSVQTLLFSATFEGKCREWSEKVVSDPKNVLRLRQEEVAHKSIMQYSLRCQTYEEKELALNDIFSYVIVGQIIVFVNRKDEAQRLSNAMKGKGHEVAFLSSDLLPAERDALMEKFRSGAQRLMVATNVIARGLDVESVSLVVNFDVPYDAAGQPDQATYLHRIGRTGRFGRAGLAFTFVSSEADEKALQLISKQLQTSVDRIERDDLLDLQANLESKGAF